MWSDPNPPTVSQNDWTAVKDGLYKKGNVLKSLGEPVNDNARHVGEKAYSASLALNLMQEDYKTRLFVVGGQGRLLVEYALGVFIDPNVLKVHIKEAHLRKDPTIFEKIKMMEEKKLASPEFRVACDKLREYGNRSVHLTLDNLKPHEKPDVIKNAFIVAQALLTKVNQVQGVLVANTNTPQLYPDPHSNI
jgi:hypothetical protein